MPGTEVLLPGVTSSVSEVMGWKAARAFSACVATTKEAPPFAPFRKVRTTDLCTMCSLVRLSSTGHTLFQNPTPRALHFRLAEWYASGVFRSSISSRRAISQGEQTMSQTVSIAPQSLRCSRLNPLLVLFCLLIFVAVPLSATGWHTSGAQIDNPSGAPFVISG